MYLQLLVCFVAIVLYVVYSSGTNTYHDPARYQRKLRSYINILIVILILQSALRNVAVGADTYAYFVKYNGLINQHWNELFDAFRRAYIEGVEKDPGYSVFEKIIQIISTDYQIFLFVVASFFFIGLAKMFRYMNLNLGGICMAILLYEVLFYGFFSITGIRQTIATGFFFYAFPFLKNRKIIPYILIMLIAATIHKSSLILIPFYFVANFNYPRKFLIYVLIAFPFLFGIARTFAIYITQFQLFESYSGYALSTYETSGAINFTIFLIIIAIITLVVVKKNLARASLSTKICINALSLAILFAPLTWVDPSLMRVCQYFSVFTIFIIGPILQTYATKHNINFESIILSVFLIFAIVIIKRGSEYAFFWQDMMLPQNYKSITL